MTIRELIEKLQELPQDLIVKFEYDGPDARAHVCVHFITEYDDSVILSEE